MEKTNVRAVEVGRKGAPSRMLRHVSHSHTQSLNRDRAYNQAHEMFGNGTLPLDIGNQLKKALLSRCPWSSEHHDEQGLIKANSRSIHLYCLNPKIVELQELLNDTLESIVRDRILIAQDAQRMLNHINGGEQDDNVGQERNDIINMMNAIIVSIPTNETDITLN